MKDYNNGRCEYDVRHDTITVERITQNGQRMYKIPELGISAGALNIGGIPVAMQGKLFVTPETVEHIPVTHKTGVIRIDYK